MRLLVCGGRNFTDVELLERTLSKIKESYVIECLIEGGAWGADYLASQWAFKHGVWNERFPAEWGKYGKSAGPIRNKQMLDEGKPNLVLAFPGGKGTANMIMQAEAAGVEVIIVASGL